MVWLAMLNATAQGVILPVLTIDCPTNLTLFTCEQALPWQYAPPTVTGGCLPYQLVCDPPSGSIFRQGTTTVTCKVTDECGNSDGCRFSVTVKPDIEPPVIECPRDLVIGSCPSPTGLCGTVVSYPAPVVTDNSGLVGVVCQPPSGSFFPCGVTTVTCRAVDRCGNKAECSFTVTVAREGQAPGIQCPSDIVVGTCSNTATVFYRDPVVNPVGTPVECFPPSGSLFPLGVSVVECLASNNCGRAECKFTVTVRPVPPPQILCPSAAAGTVIPLPVFVVPCGSNCVPVIYSAPIVLNGELVGCTPRSGTCLPVGVHTVICVATNRCGERDVCRFDIQVVQGEGEPPVIRCPQDLTVTTCSNCVPVFYPNPVVLNGSLVKCEPPSGSCFPIGVTTVTCLAASECGKAECSFSIVVRPVPPPVIRCPITPADGPLVFTVPCGSNCVPVIYPAPIVLNGELVGCTPRSGTCLPVGVHTITCVATNRCGERDACEFVVRVVQGQGEPPVIRCPNDLTVLTCSNCVPVLYPAPSVSGGGPVVCTPPSGSCFPVGSSIVSCVVSNECGRSECKFTITVRNPAPPSIVCPTNPVVVTMPCGSNCVPVFYPPPSVANGSLVKCDPPSGSCLAPGIHVVTCVAENECGVRDLCEFRVRVLAGPGEPPVIRCPQDLVVGLCRGECEPVYYTPPTVANGTLIGCTPPSGSCLPPGVHPVVCIASNECGKSECRFTITVRRGNPCLTPPGNMVLWLPFDEPAGPIAHNIVAGAPNGVHVGGPTPILGDYVLNSLGFNGLNQFVGVPNYPAIRLSASDLSIDAWIQVREATGSRTIVSKVHAVGSVGTPRGYEFYLRLGRLNLDLFGAAYQNFDSGVVVPADNAWHHVAVTVHRGGGGEVRFFLDGAGLASLAGPITTPLGNSGRLQVGLSTQAGPGPMVPFRGSIDEVEIFNRALTPLEVQYLWQADRAGKCKLKCSIPWDVSFLENQVYVTVSALLCNNTAVPQPIVWSATGPMPIPTSAGAFILAPFSCTNLPIQLGRPTNGLMVGAVVTWDLTVLTANRCPIFCKGSVINPGPLVVKVPTDPVLIPGIKCEGIVRLALNGTSPGQPIRLRVTGPDMEPDLDTVSLNGLPPGQPVILRASPDALGNFEFDLSIQFVQEDPIGTYTILLEADVNGDNAFDTLASFDVQNPVVGPPEIRIVTREGRRFLFWEEPACGHAILETSKRVFGPWEALPNAAPGFWMDTTVTEHQFFRLVVP